MKKIVTSLEKIAKTISISISLFVCSIIIYLNPIKDKVPSYFAAFISFVFLCISIYRLKKYSITFQKLKKIFKSDKIDILGICTITFFISIYLFFLIVFLVSGFTY